VDDGNVLAELALEDAVKVLGAPDAYNGRKKGETTSEKARRR
jgi:hypothetical protein